MKSNPYAFLHLALAIGLILIAGQVKKKLNEDKARRLLALRTEP